MKKLVLFITAALLAGITAQAATDLGSHNHKDGVEKRYRHKQSIMFIEGGVKFFVFSNGDVDFTILNPRRRSSYSPNTWGWNTGRYNTPGEKFGRHTWYHNMVRYDYNGRLIRVKRNYLSYNRYDQVRRIGTINLRYNRKGLVSQIGGQRIFYHRNGRISHVEGSIHFNGCGHCGMNGCTTTHGAHNSSSDWNQNDGNYYDRDRFQYRERNRELEN
ncbi:hypothetical protein [Aquimarina brevivitae]|uniref:Teneurin-like YD-shell domain-containing protein n=1 Tax=Aquimarina brevivitae TaxID=323412 RepID=A0A4Q7P2L9_9FLAO|nr:hypothetical protein [Aquimarina brevivitae]RZS93620.1 hypothetical protein EV197_2200 [Aquimarina brevivitae]